VSNILLLLTGCINPNNMSFTVLQDIDIRKNQYIAAIRFYLNSSKCRILFVENSGNDISNYFQNEIFSKRLEILVFNGNDYDTKLGKGYGEMLIINYAFDKSEFIKSSDFIFKITGRYKIINHESFEKYYETKKPDLMINLNSNILLADSRFFGATPYFYTRILLDFKSIVNDTNGIYFEHALSKSVQRALLEGQNYSSLHYLPRYSGITGTDGRVYNDSFLYWFRRSILLKISNFIRIFLNIR
jgi:hypothetical protein